MRRRPILLYREDDPAAGGGEPAGEPIEPADDPVAGDGDQVMLTRAEVEALRRQAREGREARKQAEKDRREAEERRAREQGEWEQLARQREVERDAAITKAERVEREARVTRLASGRFHDPTDVLGRLDDTDLVDEAATKAALDRVAREAPHLVRPPDQQSRPEIGQVKAPDGVLPAEAPNQPETDLTWEQVNSMSAAELAALDDKGWEKVNKVLAAGPPS